MVLGKNIELSELSQELMQKFINSYETDPQISITQGLSIDRAGLLSWLNDISARFEKASEEPAKELTFLLLSLRTSLLHDVSVSLSGKENEPERPIKAARSIGAKIKLTLLMLGGFLAAACEGFDSTATMLNLFSIPSWVVIAGAVCVSVLSVFAFCGTELLKISNALGVKVSEVRKLIDISLQQLNEIKLIRKKIASYKLAALSEEELHYITELLLMLEQRLAQLMTLGEQFNQALNSDQVQTTRLVFSVIAGALFFGSGFCAGQTVSLLLLGLLMPVTPISIPVLLFSILVGLATIKWAEFSGVRKMVSKWFGLDEDRIEILCNKEKQSSEQAKLNTLRSNVSACMDLKKQMAQLEKNAQTAPETSSSEINSVEESESIFVGNNPYSFMNAPRAARQSAQQNTRLTRSYSATF